MFYGAADHARIGITHRPGRFPRASVSYVSGDHAAKSSAHAPLARLDRARLRAEIPPAPQAAKWEVHARRGQLEAELVDPS